MVRCTQSQRSESTSCCRCVFVIYHLSFVVCLLLESVNQEDRQHVVSRAGKTRVKLHMPAGAVLRVEEAIAAATAAAVKAAEVRTWVACTQMHICMDFYLHSCNYLCSYAHINTILLSSTHILFLTCTHTRKHTKEKAAVDAAAAAEAREAAELEAQRLEWEEQELALMEERALQREESRASLGSNAVASRLLQGGCCAFVQSCACFFVALSACALRALSCMIFCGTVWMCLHTVLLSCLCVASVQAQADAHTCKHKQCVHTLSFFQKRKYKHMHALNFL